ncbi:hypothetical protein Glove_141g51 [Diversispora epigaea]|uniref:Uncharacterized protein n=1 Tax=Diversispora epigaea TaxID=1348612 RepID=A0A397IUT9_9GLOM|nr:hypothetical protein Glove_141g51 [Diversispora epigaea]
MKSTLTSPDVEFYSPKVVNRAQLAIIKHYRKMKNRYTPYISSCLNDKGTGDHLEMAEDIGKRYITSPPASCYLWNRPSRAERIALRKKNTGIKFRDGFFNYARSPASRKPCYNNPYEQYQIERMGRIGQTYEKVKWEAIGVNRSVFSNPNLTSSEHLENRRIRLNATSSRNVATPTEQLS